MAPMTARLTTGSAAPEFTLPNQDGDNVSLSDYAGKSVILYFYPAAMTPGCTTQAVDFSSATDAFAEAGYTVVGCSPDPVDRLAKFRDLSNVNFTLLADPDKTVHNLYGAYGPASCTAKGSRACSAPPS